MEQIQGRFYLNYTDNVINDRKNNLRRQGENRKKRRPAAQNRHKSLSWSETAHPVGLCVPSNRSIRLKQTQNGLNAPGKGHTSPVSDNP